MENLEELALERPGGRIEATLYGRSSRGILLCPPHPGYGGDRGDARLVAIAHRLAGANFAALCLDYSAYTGGVQEVEDVLLSLRYLEKMGQPPGLIGYSYGAVMASHAAARYPALSGLVLIAPPEQVDLLTIDTTSLHRLLIIYGAHDRLVAGNISKIYAAFKGKKESLSFDTDHFFGGFEERLADGCLTFFQTAAGRSHQFSGG